MDALFANTEERTIRGVLLPFNELSRTNITQTEPVMFSRGTVKIPRDPRAVWLNLEHDRYKPIGRADSIEETDEGLVATFAIDDTDEGDEALAAVQSGRLSRLSAEITDFFRDGAQAIKSRLSGAGLVTEGAFASAALFAVEGSREDHPATTDTTTAKTADTDEPTGTPDDAEASADTQEEEVTEQVATIPGALPVPPGKTEEKTEKPQSAQFAAAVLQPALRRIASATASGEDMILAQRFFAEQGNLFALNDVDYDGTNGVGAKMVQPQWLGENRGPDYIERFAPLFASDTLRSLSLGGFKWGTKPAGGTWTGNKDAIPSNTPTIVPETESATRWAGGHDIAREHKDFNTPGFFESYEYWMRRSFREWLDKTIVLTEMLAGATDIEGDDPTGLDIGPALSQMIDGAAAVINAGYTPTFATLDTNYWKTIAKIPHSDVLGYLNAQLSLRVDGDQSLDGFSIVPAPVGTVTAQHVVVGARSAATVYTLPGSPIRAEAINIANGGLDYGFFGYGGLKIEDAAGIVDVAPYTE
jgi:hypothetical protein